MPTASFFSPKICDPILVNPATGGATTPGVSLYGCALGQIGVPTGIISTEIGINLSNDGITWYPLTDPTTNTAYTIVNAGAKAAYPIPLDLTKGWQWCQLVFNGTELTS